MTDAEYAYLKKKIRELLGIEIDAYKSQQMRRRLESFVARQDGASAFRFGKSLEDNEELLESLKDVITINVSEFFRDGKPFEYLKSVVLPEILKERSHLNIWTAACSHGAEPYSMAIIMDELAPDGNHRILATDIDNNILAQASDGGPYKPNEVRNVSSAQLRKYFTTSETGHYVNDDIRRQVRFQEQNLLAEEFEQGFDLIICRNVLIYFSQEVKQRLIQQFHASLKAKGVLFLGATEAMHAQEAAGFDKLSATFYRKNGVALAGIRRDLAA